jgi:hypothetical protein
MSTIEYIFQKDTTHNLKVRVEDDFKVQLNFNPLNPNNNVEDNYTVVNIPDMPTDSSNMSVKKGLYVSDTLFVSFSWLIFLVIALILVSCVITAFFVKRTKTVVPRARLL